MKKKIGIISFIIFLFSLLITSGILNFNNVNATSTGQGTEAGVSSCAYERTMYVYKSSDYRTGYDAGWDYTNLKKDEFQYLELLEMEQIGNITQGFSENAIFGFVDAIFDCYYDKVYFFSFEITDFEIAPDEKRLYFDVHIDRKKTEVGSIGQVKFNGEWTTYSPMSLDPNIYATVGQDDTVTEVIEYDEEDQILVSNERFYIQFPSLPKKIIVNEVQIVVHNDAWYNPEFGENFNSSGNRTFSIAVGKEVTHTVNYESVCVKAWSAIKNYEIDENFLFWNSYHETRTRVFTGFMNLETGELIENATKIGVCYTDVYGNVKSVNVDIDDDLVSDIFRIQELGRIAKERDLNVSEYSELLELYNNIQTKESPFEERKGAQNVIGAVMDQATIDLVKEAYPDIETECTYIFEGPECVDFKAVYIWYDVEVGETVVGSAYDGGLHPVYGSGGEYLGIYDHEGVLVEDLAINKAGQIVDEDGTVLGIANTFTEDLTDYEALASNDKEDFGTWMNNLFNGTGSLLSNVSTGARTTVNVIITIVIIIVVVALSALFIKIFISVSSLFTLNKKKK